MTTNVMRLHDWHQELITTGRRAADMVQVRLCDGTFAQWERERGQAQKPVTAELVRQMRRVAKRFGLCILLVSPCRRMIWSETWSKR